MINNGDGGNNLFNSNAGNKDLWVMMNHKLIMSQKCDSPSTKANAALLSITSSIECKT